ncbi:MAG: hypothetical protein WCA77_02605 [Thermoplasmata archaeon]
MTEWNRVKKILDSEQRPEARFLDFAALLAREAGIDPQNVVVVGGSAIQVYTESAYVSNDLDIVAVGHRAAIEDVLVNWGFEGTRGLRQWSRDGLDFTVDLFTIEYTGSKDLTRVVATRYGSVRVTAVEDLFLKRLDSVRSGSSTRGMDLDHAKLILDAYGDEFNWAYVDEVAKRQLTTELVAMMRGMNARSANDRAAKRIQQRVRSRAD